MSHGSRIHFQVNDRLDLHDGKIGVLQGTVAALDGKVAALDSKVAALDSKVEDLKTIVNRWFDSQAVSLNLMAEGQNRLERRMETQLDRVVTTHIRMTWAIIGSAAFAGLCFVVGWLWKMLGG